MNRNPSELGGNQGLWRGVGVLGESRTASVGLWKYTGDPKVTRFGVDKVVVKEAKVQNGRVVDLRSEAHMLRYLEHADSQHINRHFARYTLTTDDPLADTPEDVGNVGRIFIEYCPMGDLKSLINYRRWSHKLFDETTLWKLFECLVDGFTALESGNEARINPTTGWPDRPAKRRIFDRDPRDASLQNERNPWLEIIHFDVKAANMFLARHSSHSETPIVKIGDFGSAKYLRNVTPKNYVDDDARAAERRRGTLGHHPPEQFTERWDYLDWATSGVAGNYCTKTNVWGIGNVMHEALTLRTNKLSISRPFKPAFPLFGKPSLGLTYDDTLTLYTEYSQLLRDAIWSCLYEKPAHRLSLYKLKCHVVDGKRLALAAAEKAIADFPRVQAEAAAKLQEERARFLAEYERDMAVLKRDHAMYGDAEPTLIRISDPPPLKAPRINEPWEDFEVPLGPEIQIDPTSFWQAGLSRIPRSKAHGFLIYDPKNGILYDPPVGPFIRRREHLLYYPGNKLYSFATNSFGHHMPQNLLDVADYRPKPTTYNNSNDYYTREYYTPSQTVPSLPVAAPAPVLPRQPSKFSDGLNHRQQYDEYQKNLARHAQVPLRPEQTQTQQASLEVHEQQNASGSIQIQPPPVQQQPGPNMGLQNLYISRDQDRRDTFMNNHEADLQPAQPPFPNYDPQSYMPVQQVPQQFNAYTSFRTANYQINPSLPVLDFYTPYMGYQQPSQSQPAPQPRPLNQGSPRGTGLSAGIYPSTTSSNNQHRAGRSGNTGVSSSNRRYQGSADMLRNQRGTINKNYSQVGSPVRPTVTPQNFPVLGAPGPVVPNGTPKKTSGELDVDRLNGVNRSGSDNSGDSGAGSSGRKGKKVVYKPWDGR